MSPFFTSSFQLRPVFILGAALFLISLCNARFRRNILDARSNARRWLLFASVIYFCLASYSKYSQLQARVLNGIDFWLIEDLFRHVASGQPYVTRFAGQAGPLQHGGMHAYLTIGTLVPAIKLIGSTGTALLLIPFSFALTGYLIGRRLSNSTHSSFLILGFPIAFWMSEWTNRVLLYDTHPEALYAPLVFLTLLASERVMSSRRPIDWTLFLLSWLALAGVKQDALVYGSVLCFFLVIARKMKALPALVSLICVGAVFLVMTRLISLFKGGSIGPHEIELGGFAVPVALVKGGVAGLSGHVIASASDLYSVIGVFMPDGFFAFLKRGLHYLVLSPFTMMTLIAPWLWLRRSFWLLVVPVALLIGGINNSMAGLQTYNSMIFICFIWLSLSLEVETAIKKKSRGFLLAAVAWSLTFCAVHGGSSPIFYSPSPDSVKMGTEAALIAKNQSGLGIVSSRLLNDVDSEKIWSDLPPSEEQEFVNPPDFVKWVLFPKTGESFEFKIYQFSSWREWALTHGWHQVDGEFVDLLVRE